MEELLKALTRAANAVADYYEGSHRYAEKKAAAELAPVAEKPLSEDVPVKTRKPRAPKEEKVAAPAPASTPAMTASEVIAGPISEDDSLKELRALAKTYVMRFANQVDGIAAFRKLIADTTGVARIDDLVHAQRLTVIAKAKMEIAQKDKPAAAAPVAETSGVAV